MADESQSYEEAIAGDGPRLLREDAIAPSENPGAEAEQPFFELSRLMVVALDAKTSRLQSRAQTKPNGPWEDDWSVIDDAHTYQRFVADTTRDGRVAVVAEATSGSILYIVETPDDPGPKQSWNEPVDLGDPEKDDALSGLATTRDTDGRLEIFAATQSGKMWWKYQNPDRIVEKEIKITPPGSDTPITIKVEEREPPLTPWSDWMALAPVSLNHLTAARTATGRVMLLGIMPGGAIAWSEQEKGRSLTAGDWSPWAQMDDTQTGKFKALAPTPDAEGVLNLFGLGVNGRVYHTRRSRDGWTPWATPGLTDGDIAALATGIQADGAMLLACCGVDKTLCFNAQMGPAGLLWSGWRPFNSSDWTTELQLNYNADGRLSLFSHWLLPESVGVGGLWTLSQVALDGTEWYVDWMQLAPGGIQQFAVVRDLTPPAD